MTFEALSAWVARADQRKLAAWVFAVGAAECLVVGRFPASLPLWLPYEFSWGVFLCAVFGIIWYLRGFHLLDPPERPRPWRRFAYLLGLSLIYASMQTYVDYAAQHMFFIHRLQHLVLHHSGPLLVALGNPGSVLARGMPQDLKRWLSAFWVRHILAVVQQPVVASFLFVGLIYLWPAPPVHFYAMLDPRLYTVMNWSVTLDGLLFWSLILDPKPAPEARLGYGTRVLICFAIMPPQILLGAVVTLSTTDHFTVYAICGRIIGMTGLQDQQLAGIILWIPGAMMSVVAALIVLNFLRLNDERNELAMIKAVPADA